MFSIVKGETKIYDGNIETIPDLWIRVKSKDKFFLCPSVSSRQAFSNAAKNSFAPSSSWKMIQCQILESKFSEYGIWESNLN